MTMNETPIRGHEVTLARFLKNTDELLDLALREKVTLTKDGRPKWHITEASYLDRLEAIAAGNLLEALDHIHGATRDRSTVERQEIEANMLPHEAIANDRRNDV